MGEAASEAVGRLVRECGEKAFAFAFRLTGNADDAGDLVQEAYRRVLAKWERYDPSRPVEYWFLAILRHLFLDGAKRRDRRRLVSLDAPLERGEDAPCWTERLPDGDEGILEALERRERAGLVRRALETLSYEHRAALTLSDVEGLPYGEIARVLDCPGGTVRSRISRARAALKAALAQGLKLDEVGS